MNYNGNETILTTLRMTCPQKSSANGAFVKDTNTVGPTGWCDWLAEQIRTVVRPIQCAEPSFRHVAFGGRILNHNRQLAVVCFCATAVVKTVTVSPRH
jgi:hypothetical protein